MAIDAITNFGRCTVSVGYDSTATSIVLATGEGARFPDPDADGEFNLEWWDNTTYGTPSLDPNREIIRVTGPAGTGDTKTIVRGQEGTIASDKNVTGHTYSVILGFTKRNYDLIKAAVLKVDGIATGADVTGDNTPQAHLLASHTTDTLTNLNAKVTDATLIDTEDSRLSDDRDPNAHAINHTDGSDDIQDATNAVKGLATAAQITTLEALDTAVDQSVISGASPTFDGANITNVDADTLIADVKEANVSAVKKGQVCAIVGSSGAKFEVQLGDCDDANLIKFIGLAEVDTAQNEAGTVIHKGLLANVDTQIGNTYVNPYGETWLPGDLLYVSTTPGGLTKVPPTSGRCIEAGRTLKGNSASDTLLIIVHTNSIHTCAADGENLYYRMGDSVGVTKCIFKDYDNNEVAALDSDGNLTLDGTVDGIDVATDVAANTAKDTNVDTDLSEGTATETTVVVESSDGANATLVSASTSRAGLLTKAKFDEIVANSNKISYTDAVKVSGIDEGADVTGDNPPQAHNQAASTITDFDTEVSNNSSVVANTAKTGVTTQISNIVEDETPQLYADLDAQGNYTLGLQNIPDLAAKGAGYFFSGDGSNDYIGIPEGLAPVNFKKITLRILMYTSVVGREQRFFTIAGSDAFIRLFLSADGKLNCWMSTDGSDLLFSIEFDINTLHMIEAQINVEDKAGKIFIDGVLKGSDVWTGVPNAISDGSSRLGSGRIVGLHELDGGIFMCHVLNTIPTESETKAFSSGAPVPYKYLNASQDEKLTNSDFSSTWTGELPDGWLQVGTVDANSYLVKDDVNDRIQIYTDNGDNMGISQAILEIGKRYRYTVDVETFTSGVLILWSGDTIAAFTEAGIHTGEFTATIAAFNVQRLSGSNVNCILNSVSCVQVGCVAQYEQDGIGHNQWLDKSGNKLHGEVSGALPTNLAPSHKEQFKQPVAMTDDTAWTDVVPAGYMLNYIVFEGNNANAATLDLGSTSGASDVFLQQVIPANDIAVVVLNKLFSKTAAQSLYLNDDGAGTWNGGSVDATLYMSRVVV